MDYLWKTPMQLRVENHVTDGRSYQTVPYIKWLGQRRALKQWLKYSNFRIINLNNSPR